MVPRNGIPKCMFSIVYMSEASRCVPLIVRSVPKNNPHHLAVHGYETIELRATHVVGSIQQYMKVFARALKVYQAMYAKRPRTLNEAGGVSLDQ